ncbi:excinuclease ABC subunit UvrC [Acetobacteroides hydrogenigenes]|uniref:UvrABC system protein C n=1 Tax=Acetobacteroides hydrogenigenes TaxID=979970 RepID=A0A4R2EYV5_9BACT|nr:excinuclease ABC subunit UvrC [Acetobacteroides hydrogenigenes]TCN72164.1 excinuclease ABC subunit C [Acetobacteroides hydrogenigenes]
MSDRSVGEYLKKIVEILPNQPGVYQYLDEEGTVIYVGKAKNLKKRVSSYFTSKRYESKKLMVLVRKIRDIKHIVVPTESDALLLENNLIKKLQPRYNINLKDDKTYPWIAIKNEPFPRVFSTRRYIKDGTRYFGPYTSVTLLRTLLDLIKQIYPLRTCNLNLDESSISKGKYKACLEYHIGNCKAPCLNYYLLDEYNNLIREIVEILRGNLGDLLSMLKEKMEVAAAEYRFEEAHAIKQKIELMETYQSKSVIVSTSITNLDVFSVVMDSGSAYANFMRVKNGMVIQSHNFEIKLQIEEEKENILSFVIAEIHERLGFVSREVVVPFFPDQEFPNSTYTIPQRGDKLKLLELSEKNAKMFRLEKLKQLEKVDPERHTERILTTLKKDLQLDELPVHIECFDNSNIQGSNPVAACVVFRDAKPSKKDYRHFNVKTVVGPDDFASMREIIYRRYRRMLDEGEKLPNLIVIDGGKGQLSAAVESLKKLDLIHKIPIVGLAKRMEEIYFPNDPIPLYLDKNSESLKVLMHIRDEAHRFGITFHRNKRSSSFIKSEIKLIPGIGERSAMELYGKFKTVAKMREASQEEIAQVVGAHRAKIIFEYFNSGSNDGSQNY